MLKSDNNANNLNKVSNSSLNIATIEIDRKNSIREKQGEYEEFCNKYISKDFSSYKVNQLREIHEIGNELLNQYFITEDYVFEADILIKLQYIISEAIYNINIKQAHDTNVSNQDLNKRLRESIREMKHIKDDMKSIMTTIISIVLAISIIPTAITGIEKISPNYILPFFWSIITFGIIMIAFVYTIYQDKLKKTTWGMIAMAIILCIFFWCISFKTTIEKENSDYANEQQINNTY